MPQINASFPKEIIQTVNDVWKLNYPHVRSFSEMVLTLVKKSLITEPKNTEVNESDKK